MITSNQAYAQLVNANADNVATAMFTIVDRLQQFKAGEQIAAAAILSMLMAERFGITNEDAFRVGERIIRASDYYTRGEQFRAAREYLKNEVRA